MSLQAARPYECKIAWVSEKTRGKALGQEPEPRPATDRGIAGERPDRTENPVPESQFTRLPQPDRSREKREEKQRETRKEAREKSSKKEGNGKAP
jgi:hypothetical protein